MITPLSRVEAISMMIPTISPTERRDKATAATQRTGNGYPDEVAVPTRMPTMGNHLARYLNVRLSRVFLETPIRMMANVIRKNSGSSSG